MTKSLPFYFALSFGLIFTFISCEKDQTRCDAFNYVGAYHGVIDETNNDPNFTTELYKNENCEVFIDFCPELGFDTRIEIQGNQVTIPPQIQTIEALLTLDSLDYWKLETTGTGTYNNGTLTIDFTRRSNYYNSSTFEPYSTNRVTLTAFN